MSLVITARRSFEGGSKGICGFTDIPNGSEPGTDGLALPVAIGLQLLMLWIGHPANCFVDAHD